MANKTRRTAHNERKSKHPDVYEEKKAELCRVYRQMKHNEELLGRLKEIRAPKNVIEGAERCLTESRADFDRKLTELDDLCRKVLEAIFGDGE